MVSDRPVRTPVAARAASRLLGGAAAVALLSGVAYAQTPITTTPQGPTLGGAAPPLAVPATATGSSNGAPADASNQVEELVVTGSRIVRDGFQAPTPVTVVSRDELTSGAPSNIPDALNQLPQFQNSSKPANAGPAAGGNNGGNYLNLRGLGPSRTLVLVDGRRSVPSNSSSATDINLIPQSLVSRVDVVTGGASAAYGSDAVAGVVNFVLDTKFTGLKGEVFGGQSTYGDDTSYKISLTGGTGFAGGRGHVVASAEYFQREGFQYPHGREWASKSYGVISTPTGVPTTLITAGAATANSTYGGLITTPASIANQMFLPGGALAPFNTGTLRTANTQVGGDGVMDVAALPAKLGYGTGFIHASYDLTDHISIFAEATVAESTTQYVSTNLNTSGTTALTIFSGNPFIPAALQQTLTANNIASFTLGRIDRDFTRPHFNNLNNAENFVGGVNAELWGGWKLNAYYEHGQNILRTQTMSNPIYQNLFAAVDAVRAPSGSIVCRSDLMGATSGCTPINVFGEGSPSQAAVNYVTGTSYSRQKVEQDVVDGQISGEPFRLPAGPVSLAVGGEYRKVSTNQVTDAISQSLITNTAIRGLPTSLVNKLGGFYLTNPQPSSGGYDIKEGFAETVVPVFKDMPFAHSADINAAVRYTDYSISGGVTTWKIGATYEPVEEVRLRFTRSRDIRAANFAELFSGTTQSQGLLNDPNFKNAAVRFFSRRAGNPNLQPEKADTTTAGIVYQPHWLPGFSFSFDAFKIDIADAISVPTPQDVVNACAAGVVAQCALVTRDATGALVAVTAAYQNAAALNLDGFDIESSYRRQIFDGNFVARFLVSHIGKYEQKLGAAAAVDHAGDLGNSIANITYGVPRYSATLALSYDRGPIGLFFQERFISASHYDHTLVEGVGISDNSIPETFYTDVTAKYRFTADGHKMEAFFTVNNLLDQDPQIAPSATTATFYPTNVNVYDQTGRYYTAGLRFQF